MKNWTQLIAGLLAAGLGVVTVVTGQIRSGTIREMSATGPAARFVGALLIVMSIIILRDWVKKGTKNGKQ